MSSTNSRSLRSYLLLAALFVPTCVSVLAQQGSDLLPSYEGQNVVSVELAGRNDIDRSALEPLIAQKPGQPLHRENIDKTITNLESRSTGPKSAIKNVQLRIIPQANGIRVIFILEPALYIGMYEFPGAERFPYSRLLQVTNYQSQQPYSSHDIDAATVALQNFLQRTGYFLAQVSPAVQTDPVAGIANVNFNVVLNQRAHVGNIVLQGTTPEESAKLKRALGSIIARLRSSSLKPGQTYTLARLNAATNYLQRELASQGYLSAQVKLISAEYEAPTNHAKITFSISTGPKVSIKTKGVHLWSWTRNSLIPIYQEHVVNDELIQEGQRDLLSYFQSKGYFDVKVGTNIERQPNHIAVIYQIDKGKRHKVEDVSIAGNKHFGEDELMPQVDVKKSHLFFEHGKYSQQLVAASTRKLTDFYRSVGYGQAKVTSKVNNRTGNIAVTFYVDEGVLDSVNNLEIIGNNSLPESELAPKGINLGPGKPYSQKLVQEDRNQIMARYLSLGYLTATFRAVARPSGDDPHRLDVTYSIYEGPRVQTASVVTIGRNHTQQELVSRVDGMQEGRALSTNEMLTSEGRLYRLGVFDWASVEPRRPVTTQSQEEVLVKVHEGRRNALTYGFGFEVINRGGSVPSGTVAVPGLPPVGLPKTFKTSEKTFYGPRGSIEYTRTNLRGHAETFSVGGLAGRLDQRVSAQYSDPFFRNTKWSSSTTAAFEHDSQNPIFTSRLGDLGFQLQRSLKGRANTLLVQYNFRKTSLTRLLIPDLVPPQDRSVRLSTFGSTFIHDTRDNVLDAHRGTYDSYELSINPSQLGSSVDFVRFVGQTAYYRPMGAGVVWANSIRLGLEQAYSGSHVPISEAFFSGGGSTLRGFPLNGAGPQRTISACGNASDASTCSPITVPVGGNQLLILNSEVRFPLFIMKNLGAAVFYDGGSVFSRIGFQNFGSNYTNSVGGGLRYSTPVGPIRIDIGHNLSGIPGIKSTQIFITLGQAF